MLKIALLKIALLKIALLKFGFEGGDDGEGALQGVGESLVEMEVGDAEGFGEVAQGILTTIWFLDLQSRSSTAER